MILQRIERCAGFVVVGPRAHILLTYKRKKGISLPKGHIDVDDQGRPVETPEQAGLRETVEEGGVSRDRLTTVRPLGSYVRRIEGSFKVIQLFLGTTDQVDLSPTDKKHIAWWAPQRDAYDLLRIDRPRDALQLLRYRSHIQRLPVPILRVRPSQVLKPQPAAHRVAALAA